MAAVLSSSSLSGELVREDFTFSSSFDGTTPLCATATYEKGASRLPLMVVQYGYGGNRGNVAYSARRMAQRGFFCICISTRGHGGSSGKQDDGGIEIMDIYDGIQAAFSKYPVQIETNKVSIVGYSNGGGNVFFATMRFPYLFRASLSFFGIPDYGMWNASGGAYGVTKAVGGKVSEVPDKYIVRNAILAVGNLSGTRFHTVYDEGETICPVPMQEAFIAAVRKTGYPDLVVHVSKAGDTNRWGHGYNNGHLNVAEDLFMDDIAKIQAPRPTMKPAGELTVLGFLVTPRFTCVLGKGDDAAARIKYEFKGDAVKFTLIPMTSDRQAKAIVTLADPAPQARQVVLNGKNTAVIEKGGKLVAEGTLDSVIEFCPAPGDATGGDRD